MFLKSIEIRGFKSFADKTEVHFNEGITSIVGPNGSGKSNISDAARWVLGEQSAKSLRGGKMEDVIFSGTQFRKALGLCQVTLVLDNSDNSLPIEYEEVRITRRLFRSGESEYYLNSTQCRLKDIQELFMDTGIGKEGYSIIGQGKIEAVLSGKPEDRRELLEEAAGIVKFKSRKEEAEKRLNNTEQNLIRLNDILVTYEERLAPLEKESKKAKEFLELSTELKEKEVSLIIHSYDKTTEKLKELKEAKGEKESDFASIQEELNSLKEKNKNLNLTFERVDLDINKINSKYYSNKSEEQSLEAQISIQKEKEEGLKNNIKKNEEEKIKLKDKLSHLQKEELLINERLYSHENELHKYKEQLKNQDEKIKEVEGLINSKNKAVKEFKEEQFEHLSKISNIKNNITIIKNDIASLLNKKEGIEKSIGSYNHSIKINSSTKDSLEKEIVSIEKLTCNLEGEYKKNRSEMSKLTNSLYEREKEYKSISGELNKLQGNLNLLINLEKSYEGYNRASKSLLVHVHKGIDKIEKENVKILGEIIEVEEKYEKAIEVALGGAISDIITKDEEVAKKLINYLKEKNLGRATFLPLTIVKGKTVTGVDRISKIEGFIDIASNLVKRESTYDNAVEYILSRTIVAEDLESALKIARACNYSYKIVTLLGDVVNSGGSLTGGSHYNKSINIISRKREIEENTKEIHSSENILKELQEEIDNTKNKIRNLDEANINIKDKVYHLNIEITKLKGKINVIEEEAIKLKSNINVGTTELANIKLKIEENNKLIEEKHHELLEIQKRQKNEYLSIEEMEKENVVLYEELKKLKDVLTDSRVSKAQYDEKVLFLKREKDRIVKELVEGNTKEEELNKDIENGKTNIKECRDKVSFFFSKAQSIKEELVGLEKELKESEAEKTNVKKLIQLNNEKLEESLLLSSKKEEEIHKINLNLTKNQLELESLYSKLSEEYKLTIEEGRNLYKAIEGIESQRKLISSIREKINFLGMVNVAAIDEFKELTEKLNFINTQREDLTKAKEELVLVIKDLTSKMKEVFVENFNKLRVYFNETFKELFKGGSADLLLEGDVLEGNIQINVMPPGKKLQNINLLSGGEKGLSAIALLFAILKMKPTPFCLLDEIEAALDDANVLRYAEFLKKFSKNSQFIVITHRKGTMESSDALYGVTMEEKGVSKVVSVDLKDKSII